MLFGESAFYLERMNIYAVFSVNLFIDISVRKKNGCF